MVCSEPVDNISFVFCLHSLYTGNNKIVETYLNAYLYHDTVQTQVFFTPTGATITILSPRFWVTPFFLVGGWGHSHCQSSTIVLLLVNSDLENQFLKETQFQLLFIIAKISDSFINIFHHPLLPPPHQPPPHPKSLQLLQSLQTCKWNSK